MPGPSLTSPLLCGPQSPTGSPQKGFDELLSRSLPSYRKKDIQDGGIQGEICARVWILHSTPGGTFSPGGSRADNPKNLRVKTLRPQWAPGEEIFSGLGWPGKLSVGQGEERSFSVLGLQGDTFGVSLPFFSQHLSWKLVLINNKLDYVRIQLHKNSNLLGLFLPMSLDDIQLKKGCLGSSLHSCGVEVGPGVSVALRVRACPKPCGKLDQGAAFCHGELLPPLL